MADSIHEDGADAGGTEDDFDLSAEDHSQDDDSDQDSPEDRTADDDDNSASSDDDDEGKTTSKSKTPALDSDLKDWAQKTGRVSADEAEELTDRELKFLQDVRNGQRDFSRTKATEKAQAGLQKTVRELVPKVAEEDGLDPLEIEVKALQRDFKNERTARIQAEYFARAAVTEEEVQMMGEILKEKSDKGGLRAIELWTDPENLEEWHELARTRVARNSPDDTETARAEAKQEERQRLAKISKAAGPTRSAKSTAPAKQKDELTALWEADD